MIPDLDPVAADTALPVLGVSSESTVKVVPTATVMTRLTTGTLPGLMWMLFTGTFVSSYTARRVRWCAGMTKVYVPMLTSSFTTSTSTEASATSHFLNTWPLSLT